MLVRKLKELGYWDGLVKTYRESGKNAMIKALNNLINNNHDLSFAFNAQAHDLCKDYIVYLMERNKKREVNKYEYFR